MSIVRNFGSQLSAFARDEEGDSILEKIAILGAIAVPLLVTGYFFAESVKETAAGVFDQFKGKSVSIWGG